MTTDGRSDEDIVHDHLQQAISEATTESALINGWVLVVELIGESGGRTTVTMAAPDTTVPDAYGLLRYADVALQQQQLRDP